MTAARGAPRPEAPALPVSRNLRKHTSSNPVQRWLLRRFHRQVARLVSQGLEMSGLPSPRGKAAGSFASRPPLPDPLPQGEGVDGKPVAEVLDVGCGEGFAAGALTEFLPGISLTGLDVNAAALSNARSGARRDGRNEGGAGGWVAADAARLPFRDRAFAAVLCLEVLEHLPQPWVALEEMRRVCSGHLVLSVPDQPLFSMANFVRGKNWRTLGEDPEHTWHWRGGTFLDLLAVRCQVVYATRSFPWVLALARA